MSAPAVPTMDPLVERLSAERVLPPAFRVRRIKDPAGGWVRWSHLIGAARLFGWSDQELDRAVKALEEAGRVESRAGGWTTEHRWTEREDAA